MEYTPGYFDRLDLQSQSLGWCKTEGEYKTNSYDFSVDELLLLSSVRKEFEDTIKRKAVSLEGVFDSFCAENNFVVNEVQRKALLGYLESECNGLSALDFFLADDALEEITVNGTKDIRVYHKSKGWLKTDIHFTSNEKIRILINRISRQLNRRVTLRNPRINACLDNGSRLHAAIPPIVKEPVMTIRKFREQPFSPKELVTLNTFSLEALCFVWLAIQADLNVLVVGNTGSGKTTTLNALICFVPLDERIIVVEETPEINVPHEHIVKMTVNSGIGVTMESLVEDTLRMRPDKLVVGEVRTANEVKAMMNTMLAGQGKGCFATFHAKSAAESLSRMQALGVTKEELNSIDLIIVQRRWTEYTPKKKEKRRVVEISEVVNGSAIQIFDFDYGKDTLIKVNDGAVKKKLLRTFQAYDKELVKRKRFLDAAPINFQSFLTKLGKMK